MRLSLPDDLLAKLCDLHHRQHAEMSPDWFARVEELFPDGAVFLWISLGHANYLTLGGQVVFTTPDDQPPRPVDSLRAVANILVRGSRELGLPELISALPARPEGQPACPGCGGHRWDDTPHPGYPEGTICMFCSGLGWMPPRHAEPGAAPDTAR
ncbi:MAG TPA: hypothetical protein VGE74_02830 [Gemmata sp.]